MQRCNQRLLPAIKNAKSNICVSVKEILCALFILTVKLNYAIYVYFFRACLQVPIKI